VLSVANAAESPTALLARRRCNRGVSCSWSHPAAQARRVYSTTRLGVDGSHLPATLYHLAHVSSDESFIYGQVANRLSELINDVHKVWVDRDERRELLTLKSPIAADVLPGARAL
jgi:hypothetical protein